jgi:hypothetical protein
LDDARSIGTADAMVAKAAMTAKAEVIFMIWIVKKWKSFVKEIR